jgi:hypothetical protein
LRGGLLAGGSEWDADGVIEAVWRLDALDEIGALVNSSQLKSSGRSTFVSTNQIPAQPMGGHDHER